MRKLSRLLIALLSIPFISANSLPARAAVYDIVILHGRVMDPESGLDAVRNVGIQGGVIRVVTTGAIRGRRTIEARGLVVAPGFIDLHAHGQDIENNRLQAMDGVTTALEMEGGTGDVDKWYAERAGKRILNYGATVGHGAVRKRIIPKGDEAERRAATPEEVARIRTGIDEGLQKGALGVGMLLEYAPAIGRWEVLEVFRAAAPYHASVHSHIRFGTVLEPGSALEAVEEMVAGSAVSGAPVQVVHVSSMGLRSTPQLLQVIGEAQAHGLDVTTECYPYTAFATGISSAVFDPGWQQRFAIDYGDLQWAATGERLTAESFARYQKQGGMVIAHAIPEEVVRAAVTSPLTMIASDGGIHNRKGHPRSSGTFARVLGRFVREQKLLPLMEALRKMTLMPARRVEPRDPAMRRKGRIRPGADADVDVFDPERVIDHATYDQPALPSEGFQYVLVNGVPVVDGGKLVEGVFPGQPVRAPLGPPSPSSGSTASGRHPQRG